MKTRNEIPEWLIEYLEYNTGFKRAGFFGYPYPAGTSESDAVFEFYKFISKPKNLIKFPEVKELVDSAKTCFGDLQENLSCTDDEICKACKLEEALKPFKEKE